MAKCTARLAIRSDGACRQDKSKQKGNFCRKCLREQREPANLHGSEGWFEREAACLSNVQSFPGLGAHARETACSLQRKHQVAQLVFVHWEVCLHTLESLTTSCGRRNRTISLHRSTSSKARSSRLVPIRRRDDERAFALSSRREERLAARLPLRCDICENSVSLMIPEKCRLQQPYFYGWVTGVTDTTAPRRRYTYEIDY